MPMDEPERRTIAVWDFPTRVFKWSLVLTVCVGFIFSSGRPHGSLFLVHVTCGYMVTLLLLFRFVWGFIGGEHARFRSFVRGWRSVSAYSQGLLRLDPPRIVGHNPVGSWMIIALLATLSTIVLSGLLAEGKTGGSGPLSTLLPTNVVAVVGDAHSWLGFLIMWLAGVHVAGVLFESLLHRENLILTMITGRMRTAGPNYVDARRAPLWRVAILVSMLAILGAWLAASTHIPPTPTLSMVDTH
jgi:cytochrome b